MADIVEIRKAVEAKLVSDEDDLLAELADMVGEDFAIPRDRAREGMRVFFAYLNTLRERLCASDTRELLKKDFERSGPALAAMLAADAYLTSLGLPAQATVGALIVKLGTDRICSG